MSEANNGTDDLQVHGVGSSRRSRSLVQKPFSHAHEVMGRLCPRENIIAIWLLDSWSDVCEGLQNHGMEAVWLYPLLSDSIWRYGRLWCWCIEYSCTLHIWISQLAVMYLQLGRFLIPVSTLPQESLGFPEEVSSWSSFHDQQTDLSNHTPKCVHTRQTFAHMGI